MSGTYGLEKFAHLEDKIYRTVEQFKREREERQALEQEMLALRGELGRVTGEHFGDHLAEVGRVEGACR